MSLSSGIDQNNPDLDYRGKFYPDLIPFNHPAGQQGLGSVLQVNNSALTPFGAIPQDATDFNTLGCVKIETGTIGQGNNLALVVGEAGDTLQIKGATLLGSLLVGNGLNTEGLPVGANGLVLKANSGAPLGVEWGTDASGGGTVMAVNAGTNISVSGTIAQPIVNFATPTTADIEIGVGQQIIAKDNYATPLYTMSIDATGFNDTYLVGGVENKEDIAVSATSVVQTLSTTSTGDYINSAVITCDTNYVSDTRSSQILTAGLEKNASASITTNVSSSNPFAGFGCGVSAPTSSPYPNIDAQISMDCIDVSTPQFSLSQSAPFAPTYSTIIGKDGINQNNSAGAGFSVISAQDISLLPQQNLLITSGNINATATNLSITSATTGGTANPMLILDNTNTALTAPAGSSAIRFKKNTSTNGSAIGELSFQANSTTSTGIEYARIGATIRSNTTANLDGSISLQARVNNVLTEMVRINGQDNQVEFFKTIDLGTTADIISSAGNVNISSTLGDVNITAPTGAKTIALTSASNVDITATGDNLTLTGGSAIAIVSPVVEFQGTNTTTAGGATAVLFHAGSAIPNIGTYLKLKLNGADIWIPYSTTDPT